MNRTCDPVAHFKHERFDGPLHVIWSGLGLAIATRVVAEVGAVDQTLVHVEHNRQPLLSRSYHCLHTRGCAMQALTGHSPSCVVVVVPHRGHPESQAAVRWPGAHVRGGVVLSTPAAMLPCWQLVAWPSAGWLAAGRVVHLQCSSREPPRAAGDIFGLRRL